MNQPAKKNMGVNFSCFQNTCQKPSCAAEFHPCSDDGCCSCCSCKWCCPCCRCSKTCCSEDEQNEKSPSKHKKKNPSTSSLSPTAYHHEEKVLYRDSKMRVVILSTPQIHQDYFVPWEDLDECEIHIVSSDEKGQLRFVSMQSFTDALFLNADLINNEQFVPHNKVVEDVIPPEYQKFLLPIYRQTLNGNHLQMVVMIGFGSTIRLLRTFPIWGHDAVVQAAMLVFSPHISSFGNTNINHFVLPSASNSFASLPRIENTHTHTHTHQHQTPPAQEMISEMTTATATATGTSTSTRPRSNSPLQPITMTTHDGMMPSPFRRLSHSHTFRNHSQQMTNTVPVPVPAPTPISASVSMPPTLIPS